MVGVGAAAMFGSACDAPESKTGLNPDGPPMVRQVFVREIVTRPDMTTVIRKGLAFGDHPDVPLEQDDREVLTAVALTNDPIRVVLDELVLGNNLEEIACLDGTFARVPVDADPDDIRDCAPTNLEAGKCTAVCQTNGGIKDENEDGAPDFDGRRMLEVAPGMLAVQIICDGVNVAIDPIASFYNPAGNQQLTAGPLGINSLGPALVLVPSGGQRTGSTCTIAFDASVVDKDNIQVCAPPSGDVTQNCTPGDTALVEWGTEVLKLSQSDPAPDAVNVPVVSGGGPDKSFTLLFNANISVEAIATGFSLIENPGAGEVDRTADIVATINENDGSNVILVVTGGLTGNADYELRMTPTLTDIYGGAMPQMGVLAFTTGAGPVVDAAVDAM